MFCKVSSFVAYVTLASLFILCLLLADTVSAGVIDGVLLCLQVLIPSLLIFLILSDLLQPLFQRFAVPRPLRWLCRTVFHMDGRFFYIFVLGSLGGYPIGAKLIADAVEKGHLRAEQAKYLLRFCICSSPAFLISSISMVLWHNVTSGLFLYGIQLLVAVLIALFGGHKQYIPYLKPCDPTATEPFSVLLVGAVHRSIRQMSMICGFVLLFCGLFSLIALIPLPDTASLLLKGLLEVSVGCQQTISMPAYYQPLWITVFTAFGGFCVHLQILALCQNIPLQYRDFLITRVVLTLISGGIVYALLQFFPAAINCFAPMGDYAVVASEKGVVTSCLILLLCCFLLLVVERKTEVS